MRQLVHQTSRPFQARGLHSLSNQHQIESQEWQKRTKKVHILLWNLPWFHLHVVIRHRYRILLHRPIQKGYKW